MADLYMDHNRIKADAIQLAEDGMLLSGTNVSIDLLALPKRFYRHGWQSWSLAAWIDPGSPAMSIRSPILSAKDEDPVYAHSPRHTCAWVGAVEQADGPIILLGALGLGGRVELDGANLRGFFEAGSGEWFMAQGTEEQVFTAYSARLREKFCNPAKEAGWETRHASIPSVWCSWYSLYGWVNERTFLKALDGLQDLPFEVVQLDDGWELAVGDWEANKKFPAGMAAMAGKIRDSGRTPGLWLAPFMVTLNSALARQHPDWLLRDQQGQPVRAGLSWNGVTYTLDSSHPEVLEWLDGLIRKVRGWGYAYLKLDFLYAGALPGVRKNDLPREAAYRQAMERIRAAAGDAYILGCGAPILPSLGVCDGLRVGPDVAPYWINTPMSVWLNNPNHPGTHNAIRTSLGRLWLQPVIHTDPDVVFFRSRPNALTPEQKACLRDLSLLSGFKATSDLPNWLRPSERQDVLAFLAAQPRIEHTGRYRYCIDGQEVDFAALIPVPEPRKYPVGLATTLGLWDMGVYEVIPAMLESFGIHLWDTA